MSFPQDLPGGSEVSAVRLSGLQARYATETVKHPTEFSFSATVARGFMNSSLEPPSVNLRSLSVDLSSSKKGDRATPGVDDA